MGKLDLALKLRLIRYVLGGTLYFAALLGVCPWLFIAAYGVFGADILFKAVKSIRRGQVFNEHFLMSIATIGALYIGLYSEAVLVMVFFQVGEFFQDMAVGRSRQSIRELMDLKAEYANLSDGSQACPSKVQIGDIILVRPGEKVPLDGVILEGRAQVDASSLIGEAVPRTMEAGQEILSGMVNLTAVLKVKVTADFENSTVTKIMELVDSAAAKKSKTERFITQFSKVYTPIVTISALLLMFIPMLIFPGSYPHDWILRAIVFLMISCPCALHLSVPLSFFSGVGAASRMGVLVKGTTHLQTLANIDTIAFDKTGTVTCGVFQVTKIAPIEGVTGDELLKIAAQIESNSNHPIAKSIIKEYGKPVSGLIKTEEIAGKGLRGEIDGVQILAGNAKLLETHDVDFAPDESAAGSVVHIARGGVYIGHIIISDIIKEDSKEAIQALKDLGIKKTVMLSGDRACVVESVAKKVDIDHALGELLPADKVYALEEIYAKNPNAKVAFIGDGINDAPVLTRADVGIAMGAIGSDAAIEAADIAIMTDELSKLVPAIHTARKTMKIVRQNIIFVMLVKFAVLTLAVFGMANILWAVVADSGVTLIAALNSIRKKS
ncbi:MAG: cadmium-translocating P-type ATPase [Defluviitaleaceae bacterium]|nr:cadmium-translocating P-type ATPase [Defluviitaleaceae bacterium]